MSNNSDKKAFELAHDVDETEVRTLKQLALISGIDRPITTTTKELAAQFEENISPQTVSRRLHRLEDASLIERQVGNNGQSIRVLPKGRRTLERQYHVYRSIFQDRAVITMEGMVTSGMGEGAHYITLPGYAEQFQEKLGYMPFAGTLNIDLTAESVARRTGITSLESIPIDGWEGDDRTYGPAECYPVELEVEGSRYESAHALIPARTHHDEDQLELIAPDRLRTALDLDDGDHLTVEVGGVE